MSQVGYAQVLNVAAGGASGTPSWAELTLVKDATVTLEKDAAENSSRATGGWKSYIDGMKDVTIEAEIDYEIADAQVEIVRAAYFGNTLVGVQAFDDNGEGVQGSFIVTQFTVNEPLNEAVSISVVFRANKDSAPEWIAGT